MLLDYHLHTSFSDGKGALNQYAARALEIGLDEIGVSDHCPLPSHPERWRMAEEKLEEYVAVAYETQREYPSLTIRLGLEVDYLPGSEAYTRQLADAHPWDYFLGSVHYVGDFTVDGSAERWKGADVDKIWRDYFDLWTQAAASGLYDSMAHPDLPKKFGHTPASDMTSLYERALAVAKKSGVAIELNTSGLRRPCNEMYPSRQFLRIAHKMGIPLSLGSDAHRPEELGANFSDAVRLAGEVGYREICRFNQRRRELVPLG